MQNINMKRCKSKTEIDKQVFWICGISINLFFKEVMDRENRRRKRKTHVIETRKHDEKKRQQMNKCMSKKGHKEVTHACEKW